MTILVTGGAGYIGSVTVDLMRLRGEDVVVLDDLHRGHRSAVDPDVPFYRGSVGDTSLVSSVAAQHDIEGCIHFASLAYVGESVTDPARYFRSNVADTIALLDTLRARGVRLWVLSSSCATYGQPRTLPIDESETQSPTSPYGWTKLLLEQMLRAYDVYGLRSVSLRYFNAAGATERRGEHHEPETHLIPRLLRAASGRLPSVAVFGTDYPTPDGTAIRDYVHVADLAQAHLLALQHLRGGGDSQALNLGTGRGVSVLNVVEAARRITGRPIAICTEPRRAGDPAELVASAARAERLLGWKPAQPDLEEIVGTAWKWYQEHPNGYPD